MSSHGGSVRESRGLLAVRLGLLVLGVVTLVVIVGFTAWLIYAVGSVWLGLIRG